jgi:hypothetical protein
VKDPENIPDAVPFTITDEVNAYEAVKALIACEAVIALYAQDDVAT